MVNPGAFRGSRKEFLLGEKQAYAIARYPIELSHYEEPSAEWLASVDDNAADPEPEEPDKDKMSAVEYEAAMKKAAERKASLVFRKMQIKRWMASQYMKDSNAPPKDPGFHNPYTALLKKLIGSNLTRPRQKSAANLWRKPQKEKIEAHLQGEIELGRRLNRPVSKDDHAKIRDRIARELFAELDEETRRHWQQEAMKDHREALAEYNRQINADPSTEPEDRQLAIQGVVQFMQPILDRVVGATGWKWTLIGGGPEPANGGRLSMISMHSGYTTGDVKMTFGRAEREGYKKHIVPMFGNFLRLCYSPEECRSRALPEEGAAYVTMGSLEPDTDEATYHAIDADDTTLPVDTSTASSSVPAAPTVDTTPTSSSVPATGVDPADAPDATSIPSKDPLTPPAASPPTQPPVDPPMDTTSAESTPMARDEPGSPLCGDGDKETGGPDEDMDTASPIDNPFPFEDCEDEAPPLYLDQNAQPSPPASPPVSRVPSPAPSLQLERPLPAGIPPVPEISAAVPEVLTQPNTAQITRGDVTLVSPAAPSKSPRKRKAMDIVDNPIVEPGSKRVRTKTSRALAAEEQQTKRQKPSRNGLPKEGVQGKENTAVSGKRGNVAVKVQVSRRKR